MKFRDQLLHFWNKATKFKISELKKYAISRYQHNVKKLQNLKQTNTDLGIYHFHNKNLYDAVLRFRLVMFFAKQYDTQIYYYLGRAYIEMFKHAKAKKYIEKYLQSNHKAFQEEALFCNKIIARESKTIDHIPTSIFQRKFLRRANNLQHIPLSVYETIIQHILIQREENPGIDFRLLHIQCGNGDLGTALKRLDKIESMTGLVPISHQEQSKNSDALSAHLKTIYDKIFHEDGLHHLQNLDYDTKYGIILLHDGLFQSSNLISLFRNAHNKSTAHATLTLVFYEAENTYFNNRTETFSFSKQQIADQAEACLWLLANYTAHTNNISVITFTK